MSFYRKKPIVVEADVFPGMDKPWKASSTYIQGDVRRKSLSIVHCKHCDKPMNVHGLIETLEGEHIVCPGDYVIKGINGEFYPCKKDIFMKTYEKVETENEK